MASKATEKIVDGITQLLEGYYDLQQTVAEDLGVDDSERDEEEAAELDAEVQAALSNEMRIALESVLEEDEHSIEEVAALVSNLTEAIEEIDPNVFESSGEAEEEKDDADDDDLAFDDDEETSLEDLEEEDEGEDEKEER